MQTIEQRVSKIEERNTLVELDKAWEMSWTRRVIIGAFTYLAIALFLFIIKVEKPWIAGIVPALAFALSTLTMPLLKKQWQQWVQR